MKDIVRRKIDEIKDEFTIESDGDAFAIWSVGLVNELNNDDAYEQTDTLAKGDNGIDGWVLKNDIFNLYQCKYSLTDSTIYGKPEVKELLNGLDDLLNKEVKVNSKLEDIREKLVDHLEHGNSIVLNWIIIGYINSEAIEYLKVKIDEAQKKIRDKFNCEDINLNYEIYDSERLHEVYVNQNCLEDLSGYTMEIPVNSIDNYIEVDKPQNDSGIDKSIVINLNAKKFISVIKKDKLGSKIFDLNVRFNLGTRNKINTSIKETATDPKLSKNFWHYNNGITILVEDFYFSEEKDKKYLNLSNPQVVNGCQTISTLTSVVKELGDSEFPVILTKIIKINKDTLGKKQALRISTATNSQSPVKISDLKSNDPVQKSIQARFKAYKYFYERKRKEWDTLNKSQKREYTKKKITMEELGRNWYSFIGYPSQAICNKEIIFTDDSIYKEIYKKDRAIELYILCNKIYQLFNNELAKDKVNNLVKKHRFDKTDAELIVNKVIVIEHCVAVSRRIIEEKHKNIDVDIAKVVSDLLEKESKFKEELIKIVLRAIKNEINSKNIEDKIKIFKNEKTIDNIIANSLDIFDDRIDDNEEFLNFR